MFSSDWRRKKEIQVFKQRKKFILNIQIWNSIQDWVFGSIYQAHKSSELDPAYFLYFFTKFYFPREDYLFENKDFFWHHETTTRMKTKKYQP